MAWTCCGADRAVEAGAVLSGIAEFSQQLLACFDRRSTRAGERVTHCEALVSWRASVRAVSETVSGEGPVGRA
jgi:hypothetical protein